MANARGPAGGRGPITGQLYRVKRNLCDRSGAVRGFGGSGGEPRTEGVLT